MPSPVCETLELTTKLIYGGAGMGIGIVISRVVASVAHAVLDRIQHDTRGQIADGGYPWILVWVVALLVGTKVLVGAL